MILTFILRYRVLQLLILHRLFKEYVKSPAANSALVENIVDGCDSEVRDVMDEYDLFERQSESNSEKTQLDLYLEEPVLVRKGNENLDVLKFWKDNMIRYPELSMMARDVLSIPISTVVSESTFSIGGRVIGKYESSILPEIAEAKLCAQDWLYGNGVADDSDEDDIEIDVEKIVARCC
ncbi:zinc finger BED domain-containing protein DAYSLEEPER-like [Lycium barbarum]|uniref:zinc finger BED domain-containing protein DAYSLEEPER-like n=1 Tax=Lycium barbarum TaxID=112863 RepID=UPI00293F386F|nr:zinc finger BED domain-containing protein DAYSLEEPER-like [Lycium barbarum]